MEWILCGYYEYAPSSILFGGLILPLSVHISACIYDSVFFPTQYILLLVEGRSKKTVAMVYQGNDKKSGRIFYYYISIKENTT